MTGTNEFSKEKVTELINEALKTMNKADANKGGVALAMSEHQEVINLIEMSLILVLTDPVRGMIALSSTMFEIGYRAAQVQAEKGKEQDNIDAEVEKILKAANGSIN